MTSEYNQNLSLFSSSVNIFLGPVKVWLKGNTGSASLLEIKEQLNITGQ